MKARNYVLGCLLFAVWAIFSPSLCLAQGGTATLRVQVTDPSGSAVAGASVTISRAPAAVKSAKADAQGQYVFRSLEPGLYTIAVTAKGFSPFEQQQYEVISGRTRSVTIPLTIAVVREQVSVDDNAAKVDVDPTSNASATVLRGPELQALSDDPNDLATDLQALAGPAAGPNGGQIFIDGFTGGRLPSKQSIREVRINQNPFAAQYDRPGQGRIEVFTKPGADAFHGQLLFMFGHDALNAQNHFSPFKPPYQRRQWEGEVTGPLAKNTSFFMDFERQDNSENAFINAKSLDQNLNVMAVQQAVVTPQTATEVNFRVDRQLTPNHTLAVRYGFNRDSADNQGVGDRTLLSRAYKTRDAEDVFQFTETGVLNTHTINETRFRYRRQRSKQIGVGSDPAINVMDSVTMGGPQMARAFNNQDRYELNNFTSIVHGAHTFRWGGLMRGVSLSDQATQNYSGTFTFTSLDSYRTTLDGLRKGWTAAQIRAAGGGASQFTIAGGNPLASVSQFDFGFFLQDDWKLRPNFTLSGGLRYEAQTNSGDLRDFGPRLGFAWGVGKGKKTVIRGGLGMFYDRLGESMTLNALRQDGTRQQSYLINSPDFYPSVPSIQSLSSSRQPQTIRRTASNWQSPQMYQAAIGVERQMTKSITVSSNFLHSRGVHTLRSRDINAPLPGSSTRPDGTNNSIYVYETMGVFRQSQLIANVNAKINAKLSFSGFYAYGNAKSNTDGAGTFPADQYDLSSEYGRAGFDIRHRVQVNGSAAFRWGFRVSPFVTFSSGRPFNITTGNRNSDGMYNQRPSLVSTWVSGVFNTPYGFLNPNPLPGQFIIPRNYGEGPSQVNVNMRLSKSFTLGKKGSDGKEASGDPKVLTLTATARNLLNSAHMSSLVGNVSAPDFNRATQLSDTRRRVILQAMFEF